MPLLILISYIAAALCGALAIALLALKRHAFPWTVFACGMVLLAVDVALAASILGTDVPADVALWQEVRLAIRSLIPGTWLVVSLCYSRGNYREFVRKWRGVVMWSFIVPVASFVGFSSSLVSTVSFSETNHLLFIGLGVGGQLIHLYLILGSILILMNFERTFRSAVGVMRWRIKYFVLGAALFFGATIYESSQALLYSGIHLLSIKIQVLATLLMTLLIGYSFLRTKLGESEIYPSYEVLQRSITFVLAVAYLLSVGLFAKFVSGLGGDPIFPIKALLLMLAIVGVTVVFFSDRVRQQIGMFVSRNFRRPIHDYRKIWALFTERTGSLIDRTQFCRAAATLISETFELLSVTVWVASERDKTLVFAASTALTEQKADKLKLTGAELDELFKMAREWKGPIDITTSLETSIRSLQQLNPDHFHKGGNRVCVPLVSGGEVVGFITAGDRVSGRRFSVEDFDLLRCLGDEVAGRLQNIELSRQLLQNKEIEAFQTMSTFFVHDLKNTTSTLSLMLQNLSIHFGDPNFREDCQRSLSRSVTHLKDLISRLTQLRHELKIQKTEGDLNDIVTSTLRDVQDGEGFSIARDLRPLPRILMDPEQIQKVVTNLILNAREAIKAAGAIRVQTAKENGWVLFSVADDGCGMSDEFIRQSLFKPFQTTKKSGLGIGLFHSKAIVEAHQGRIEVESEVGKGTTFRVLLPIS